MHSEHQIDNEAQFQFIKVRYLILLMIMGMVLFFILIAMLSGFLDGPEIAVLFGLFFYALISLWIIRNFKMFDIDYIKFIGSLPMDYNWLEVVGVVFAIIILSMGFTELNRYILSTLDPQLLSYIPGANPFYNLSDSTLAPLLNFIEFIIVVMIAPIVEEFLFRGVLFHRFTVKWSIRKAVLASSLIFGVLHADIIGAFLFGLVMCILYIKTSTILVPIFCHILNNFIAYGFQIIGTFTPETTTTGVAIYIPNLNVALFLLLFSGVIILYYVYHNFPKKYWIAPYFRKYEEEY